jgi:hypothetical protein
LNPSKTARKEFCFEAQGIWVAVFYETQKGNEFFIGQVVNIESGETGVINFLHQCGMDDSLFKFPASSDVETVDRRFVFSWDFNVTSTNGRTWRVGNIKELKKQFKQYTRRYC